MWLNLVYSEELTRARSQAGRVGPFLKIGRCYSFHLNFKNLLQSFISNILFIGCILIVGKKKSKREIILRSLGNLKRVDRFIVIYERIFGFLIIKRIVGFVGIH